MCITIMHKKTTPYSEILLVQVIWFNGISNLDGYSMPNPVYTYIFVEMIDCGDILFFYFIFKSFLKQNHFLSFSIYKQMRKMTK